jgi:hypothetical protein
MRDDGQMAERDRETRVSQEMYGSREMRPICAISCEMIDYVFQPYCIERAALVF